MRICRVVGKAQATVKHASLEGTRLLVLKDFDSTAKPAGVAFLAIDAVGAGEGETVAVAEGSAAARALPGRDAPIDSVVIAIMDSVVMDGKEVYSREEEKK
jgi:ethanolamine utilization protein EutN